MKNLLAQGMGTRTVLGYGRRQGSLGKSAGGAGTYFDSWAIAGAWDQQRQHQGARFMVNRLLELPARRPGSTDWFGRARSVVGDQTVPAARDRNRRFHLCGRPPEESGDLQSQSSLDAGANRFNRTGGQSPRCQIGRVTNRLCGCAAAGRLARFAIPGDYFQQKSNARRRPCPANHKNTKLRLIASRTEFAPSVGNPTCRPRDLGCL